MISSQTAKTAFTLTTTNQVLNFAFTILAAEDIEVTATTSAGVDSTLSLSTHYTVQVGAQTITMVGGTATDVISVYRATPHTQAASGSFNGQFPSAGYQSSLDRLVMQIQKLGLQTERSLRLPNSNGTQAALDKTARTSRLIGFDASGDLEYYGNLDTTVVLPVSIANGGTGNATSAITGTVGATTPNTGAFTTLSATGNQTFSGNNGTINFNGTGYGAIGGTVGDLYLNATTTVYIGPSNVGAFNSTGLAVTGALSVATDANIVTTKGNFNMVVNVKDYGATGNGTTSDYVAINAAIAALPAANGHLHFPAGKYLIDGALTAFGSKTYLTISGTNAVVNNTHHGNTFEIQNTCSQVDIFGIKFIGDASVRANGIHIRVHANDTSITDCSFEGASDFALFIGHDTPAALIARISVTNCLFTTCLGDGVHIGKASDVVVDGNTFYSTGDDSIAAVAESSTSRPYRITISNNNIYNSAWRGIVILEGIDCLVTGNNINGCAGASILVDRYLSTTLYNERVLIEGNKVFQSTGTSGPLGAIMIKFANDTRVLGNVITDTQNGSAINFLDVSRCSISSNEIRSSPSRAIACDDSTTTNVAAAWTNLTIKDNRISHVSANQAIYVMPATGKAITDLIIDGNCCMDLAAGDYIYYNRVTTGRISNNVNLQARSITAGATVSGVTAHNNN